MCSCARSPCLDILSVGVRDAVLHILETDPTSMYNMIRFRYGAYTALIYEMGTRDGVTLPALQLKLRIVMSYDVPLLLLLVVQKKSVLVVPCRVWCLEKKKGASHQSPVSGGSPSDGPLRNKLHCTHTYIHTYIYLRIRP